MGPLLTMQIKAMKYGRPTIVQYAAIHNSTQNLYIAIYTYGIK